MVKKLLFIFNPYAGKGQIKTKLADMIDIFVKNGYLVTAYPTQDLLDAQKMVEEKAGEYDLVVCSGGDGTLNEVVTGMMHLADKRTIGYIPTGTTNDYASSLGISKNMLQAAQIAVAGDAFSSDIGTFNGKTFVYIAAFGIFTDVSYQTSQELKHIFGHLAYILEGAKRLYSIKSYHVRVSYNDITIEDDFIYGMVTNSISVGGFKKLTGKSVLLDDGLFEVTLIKMPKNPIELQEIIATLLVENIDTKYVYTFKTDKLVLESDTEIPWTLDGEFGGNQKEVTILNNKQAITLNIDMEKMRLNDSQTEEIPKIEEE